MKYCKESSWEHPGTRGGRGIISNLRLAYSSTTLDWEDVLGMRECFAFLLVKKKNKGEAFKNHIYKFLGGKLWVLGFV